MHLPRHLLTVDFETFWSADFTLKKLSTEEYVRSPLCKIHGAAVKYESAPARWVRGPDLPAFFSQVPWEDVALLCQNAPFDGLILSHHYNVRPALYACTLAMARMALPRQRHNLRELSHHFGLPPKGDAINLTRGLWDLPPEVEAALAEYACGDADNTYGIFQPLLKAIPLSELEIIDMTVRLFTEPQLRLDRQRARDLLAKVLRSKRTALQRLETTKEEVSSSAKFSTLLEERFGIEVAMKPGKPLADGTPRWLPAVAKVDPFMKSLLEHENPDVQSLAATRLQVKSTLEETRLRRLLAMNSRGPLCVFLNFAGAHTFRWSGGDRMNWQNFPRGSELRRCILAPEGHVLVVCDLSQIEARMLNCLAEQWDVLELFAHGDPYSAMAADAYGYAVNKKDNPGERQVGKVLELGCGYGMGAPKLRITLRGGALGGAPVIVDIDTAKKYVAKYRSRHQRVTEYWGQAETALQLLDARVEGYPWGPMTIDHGYIRLPNGTALDYTGLCREDGEWHMRDRTGRLMLNTAGQPIRLYGGLMTENVVQALSRVVMSEAMPAIRKRFPIVMTTHDELVCVAPKEQGEECLQHMISTMTKRPSWLPRIPLAAEGAFDECYSK